MLLVQHFERASVCAGSVANHRGVTEARVADVRGGQNAAAGFRQRDGMDFIYAQVHEYARGTATNDTVDDRGAGQSCGELLNKFQ